MNQVNYQKEMERLIAGHGAKGEVPTVLLHSCCAPCSTHCLLYLSEYFEIIDFYYNPNIFPPEENEKRARELERLIQKEQLGSRFRHPVHFAEGAYEPERFYAAVKGLEEIPEGGARCFACFRLRLAETAKLARTLGADYFATTLTISPLKNAVKINEIGEELAARYGVRYLPSDFKKKDGYRHSCELSAEYGLYRQDYCGCVFSKRERMGFTAVKTEGKIKEASAQREWDEA